MREMKKTTAIIVVIALLFSIFAPEINVIAAAPANTGEYGSIEIGGAVTGIQDVTNGNSVTVSFENGNTVTVTGSGLYSSSEGGKYQVYGNGEVVVTATPTEGYEADLRYQGSLLGKTTETYTLENSSPVRVDGEFNVVNQQQDQEEPQPGPQSQFNGEAYFVWMSGNKVCYHKFVGLKGRKADENGYEMNYINVTELTDQSGNGGNYTWGQESANWVSARDLEDEHGDVKTPLTKEYIFGNGYEDMGVQLDPCGAQNGKNSICSNGNMEFRTTIYRNGYQAIKFDDNSENYKYFPSFWDQTFFTSTVDISGTTAAKPAIYESYLLEPSISFEAGDYSESNYIVKVEALDVNPNAVTITEIDGIYTIKFNSHYYDHVVFAITTADNNTYYVRIGRVTLDIGDNFGPNTTKPEVIATLYYPRENTYNDFEVVATIVNRDNTTETKVVSASKIDLNNPMDADRLISDYVLDGGKGLYASNYKVAVDKDDTKGVYFTVVYKGALEGETFGGTFSGSGKGVYYDLEDYQSDTFRTMVYDK